jgi:hypothetical protein
VACAGGGSDDPHVEAEALVGVVGYAGILRVNIRLLQDVIPVGSVIGCMPTEGALRWFGVCLTG